MISQTDNETLIDIKNTLKEIHKSLLYVFWIVALFAFLYFGLMIYLLLIKT